MTPQELVPFEGRTRVEVSFGEQRYSCVSTSSRLRRWFNFQKLPVNSEPETKEVVGEKAMRLLTQINSEFCIQSHVSMFDRAVILLLIERQQESERQLIESPVFDVNDYVPHKHVVLTVTNLTWES